jgi:alkanesulfonate monooxygenase SsuD/methylene tetrahydromethanopterin reductase-like flavin-dependent oxidoreductase (luciferase family)
LWIAGGGERKTLRIAAQYADYTNFDSTPDTFRHKSEVLAEHCRDLGRDFGSIVRSGNYNVVIGATDKDVQDKLAWIRAHYEPLVPADALERYGDMFATGPLVGTPDHIIDGLVAAREMGMTYAIVNFLDAAYDPTSIELFTKEVIPALVN